MLAYERLERAFITFDAYNSNDPHIEKFEGEDHPKELLYAKRMTERLNKYKSDVAEYIQLAARCQHIGRWEIPRSTYPMDKKGYLQWRNTLKAHHAKIADQILSSSGYDGETIEKVKSLLLKKELQTNADTQLLEDVICLVFVEHYLEDFAGQHDDEKVVDILKKTLRKMTPRAIQEAGKILVSDRVGTLLAKAAALK
jgi:hypothetical protein